MLVIITYEYMGIGNVVFSKSGVAYHRTNVLQTLLIIFLGMTNKNSPELSSVSFPSNWLK